MSQRQQLRLIVSQNSKRQTGATRLSSVRCAMLRIDSLTRSPSTDSPFIRKLRELESVCPEHAAVLEGLADDILAEWTRRSSLSQLE